MRRETPMAIPLYMELIQSGDIHNPAKLLCRFLDLIEPHKYAIFNASYMRKEQKYVSGKPIKVSENSIKVSTLL